MWAVPPDDIYLNRKGEEIYRVKNNQPDRTFIVKTTETQSGLYTQDQIDNGAAPVVSGISKDAAKSAEAVISNVSY
jgi:uncharacterized protein YkuJ